jgi:hypothetical protein
MINFGEMTMSGSHNPGTYQESQQSCYQYLISVLSCATMDMFVFNPNNTGLSQMMKCWRPKHFVLKVNNQPFK